MCSFCVWLSSSASTHTLFNKFHRTHTTYKLQHTLINTRILCTRRRKPVQIHTHTHSLPQHLHTGCSVRMDAFLYLCACASSLSLLRPSSSFFKIFCLYAQALHPHARGGAVAVAVYSSHTAAEAHNESPLFFCLCFLIWLSTFCCALRSFFRNCIRPRVLNIF